MIVLCTLAELKSYKGITSGADDGLLWRCIKRAQAIIESDAMTRRRFTPYAQTRRYSESYEGRRDDVLMLDTDLIELTNLANGDGSAIATSGVLLEPRNDAPTKPYTRLRLKKSVAGGWTFANDGEITITGVWGYPCPPAVVISGDGSGAEAVAVVEGDGIGQVVVVSGGQGYTTATISFVGPGNGAVAVATCTGGAVSAIAVSVHGSEYVQAPHALNQACIRLAAWLYQQRDTGAEADRPVFSGEGPVIMPARIPADIIQEVRGFLRVTA